MLDMLKWQAAALVTPQPRYRWWHAAGFGLAVNAVSTLLIGRRTDEQAYYASLKQAPFAPPGWLFPPAWTVNNVSLLWGSLALVNEPEQAPQRDALLALQALWWGLYSTFGFVYFRQRSPILAAVWTAASWALTIATTAVSLRTGRTRLIQSQLTTLAWLTLATGVAAYQARFNPDPVLGYKPTAPAA